MCRSRERDGRRAADGGDGDMKVKDTTKVFSGGREGFGAGGRGQLRSAAQTRVAGDQGGPEGWPPTTA
jgi:hypothetical protein